MVSKARLDLPEPDRPVMQIRRFRGRRTVMSLRLCSRAPWTMSSSGAIRRAIVLLERVFAKARNHCPGVGSGRLDEPGVDGVSADVLDRGAEVLLAVDHPGSEARTPQMAVPTVPEIEALGIAAVQVLHAAGEP